MILILCEKERTEVILYTESLRKRMGNVRNKEARYVKSLHHKDSFLTVYHKAVVLSRIGITPSPI